MEKREEAHASSHAGRGAEELTNKDKILNFLIECPASVNDICKETEMAWGTAKSILDELTFLGEVKEIVSNPKIRIFKHAQDPVFYGVPLTKEQRNDSLFLFAKIKEEWAKAKPNEKLKATTLQKIAVEVAKESGSSIPVAPFHFGLVVPIVNNSSLSYCAEPEYSNKLILKIKEAVKCHTNYVKNEILNQYLKFNLKLFSAKENFIGELSSNSPNDKEISAALAELFLNWPTENNETEVFDFFVSFSNIIHALIMTKSLEWEALSEVRELFNMLWDYITTYLFFKEIEKFIVPSKKEIFEYIKTAHLLSKRSSVEERIEHTQGFADMSKLEEKEANELTKEISNIMVEGAEEE